jgi:hypothetical protein
LQESALFENVKFSNLLAESPVSGFFPEHTILILMQGSIPLVAWPQPTVEAPVFRNPERPIEQRADDLISRLIIGGKISQTMMASPAIPWLGILK